MEKRDPFALVLQFLTLLALIWIGAGVSNFVGPDYGPVVSDTGNLERIAKYPLPRFGRGGASLEEPGLDSGQQFFHIRLTLQIFGRPDSHVVF